MALRPPHDSDAPSPWFRDGVSLARERAPLAGPALAFGAGLLIAALTPLPPLFGGTGIVLALLLLVAMRRARRRWRARLVRFAVPLFLGALAMTAGSPGGVPSAPGVGVDPPPGPVRVWLRILTAPRYRVPNHGPPSWRAIATVEGSSEQLFVRVPIELVIARGDRLRVEFWASAERQSITITPDRLHAHERSASPFAVADRVRARSLLRWIEQRSPMATGWWSALLLGERALLDVETRDRLRRIGQGHLLAISGLHVGLLVAIVLWPLGRIGHLRPITASIIVGVLLVAFSAIAGGDAAVVRATAFGVIIVVALIRGRIHSLVNGLATSFILLGAWWGPDAARAGFVLSYSAVAGIVFFGPPIDERPSIRDLRARGLARILRGVSWPFDRLRRALRISIAAWLGAAAALVHWTPEVVPASPLFTVIIVPALIPLLLSGVLALLLPASVVGSVLDRVAGTSGEAIGALARWFDHVPATPTLWPTLPPWAITAAVVSLGLALGRRAPTLRALLLVVSLVAIVLVSPDPQLRLLDVGRGQVCTITTDDATIGLDAGTLDRAEGGARELRHALWNCGRTRLDLLVLSHPHADHLLAIPELAPLTTIGRVMVAPRFGDEPLGAAILTYLEREGIPVTVAHRGRRYRLGSIEIDVIHPDGVPPEILRHSVNDDSLVVRLRGSGLDLVSAGDIEVAGRAQISWDENAGRDAASAGWLLAPHHGRDSPGLEAWLRSSGRRLLVSSARRTPRRALERLRRDGWEIYETARRGSITVFIDEWPRRE